MFIMGENNTEGNVTTQRVKQHDSAILLLGEFHLGEQVYNLCLYANVHSIIHNNQKWKQPKCQSTGGWVDKTQNVILFGNKNNEELMLSLSYGFPTIPLISFPLRITRWACQCCDTCLYPKVSCMSSFSQS